MRPWMTGSFVPIESTRRRMTRIMRSSQPASVSSIFFSTAPGVFVSAGSAAMMDSASLAVSTPSVNDVPPFRSRPRRIFSFGGLQT